MSILNIHNIVRQLLQSAKMIMGRSSIIIAFGKISIKLSL